MKSMGVVASGVLLALATAFEAGAVEPVEPLVGRQDVDGDGDAEVVLENAWIRLVLDPARGGRAVEVERLTDGLALTPSGDFAGWGIDRLWIPEVWFDTDAYGIEELEMKDGVARVVFATRGRTGPAAFLWIRKTWEIARDRSDVRVHYELSNEPSGMGAIVVGQWFQHYMGVPGTRNTSWIPTADGMVRHPEDKPPGKHSNQRWFEDPRRGFLGVLESEGGSGVAWTFPLEQMQTAYLWEGPVLQSSEVRTWPVELGAGEDLQSEHRLQPLHGLPRLDGAGPGVAVAIEPEPEAVVVTLLPAFSGSLEVTVARSVDGERTELARRTVEAVVDEPHRVEIPGPAMPGELVVEVRREGALLVDARRPVELERFELVADVAPMEHVDLEDRSARPPAHALSDEVVTPHHPWGRPLAGGPLRALILTDDVVARQVVEVAQRLDVEVGYTKVIYMDGRYSWQGDRSIGSVEDARLAIEAQLEEPWDVIVLGGLDMERHLGSRIASRIGGLVREGTGMVLVAPRHGRLLDAEMPLDEPSDRTPPLRYEALPSASWLGAGLPVELLPDFGALRYAQAPEDAFLVANGPQGPIPLAGATQVGEGRVVWVAWDVFSDALPKTNFAFSGLLPTPAWSRPAWRRGEEEGDWLEGPVGFDEVGYAALTRWIRYAARGRPEASLTSVRAEQDALRLALDGAVEACSVHVRWFDEWGETVWEPAPVPCAASLELPVPPVPPTGWSLAGVVLRDATGGALDWGGAALRTDAPEIRSLEVAERFLDRADDLRVELRVDRPDGLRRQVEVRDVHGRLVYRDAGPALAEETLAPQLASALSTAHVVQVDLLDADGRRLDRDQVRFALPWSADPLQPWLGVWYYSVTVRNLPLTRRLLDTVGLPVDVVIVEPGLPFMEEMRLRGHGVAPIYVLPYAPTDHKAVVGEYARTGDPRWLERDPSLTDPEWRAGVMERVRTAAERSREVGGVLGMFSADEHTLTAWGNYFDYDFSPSSQAAFREWVREEYGSVEAVEASWGVELEDFDAIEPITLEDARNRGLPAWWSDFRTYMDDTLVALLAEGEAVAREVDPSLRMGISGTQGPRSGNGMDWEKLSGAIGLFASYSMEHTDEMRLDMGDDAIRGAYATGYFRERPVLFGHVWNAVLRADHGLFGWAMPQFLYPDFADTESGALTREVREHVAAGPWQLARVAERESGVVGLHYSHRSQHGAAFEGDEPGFIAGREGWALLLDALAIPWRFVPTSAIEQGEIDVDVLVLPRSAALSDAEIASLRAYVEGGGAVLADVPPGTHDGHLSPREGRALLEWAGVRVESEAYGGVPLEILGRELDVEVADRTLRAAEGTEALGRTARGAEAAFVRPVGEGHVALLNLDPALYRAELKYRGERRELWEETTRDLLARLGATAPVTVVAPAGGSDLRLRRFVHGDRQIVAVVRQLLADAPDEPARYVLRLPPLAAVIDVATGEDLGRGGDLALDLRPGDGRMLALLEEAPARVRVPRRLRSAAGERLEVPVSIAGAAPDELVRVTVRDPDGQERPVYGGVRAVGPSGVVELPFALDDPPGRWTVEVVSVIGGARARTRVRLSPADM